MAIDPDRFRPPIFPIPTGWEPVGTIFLERFIAHAVEVNQILERTVEAIRLSVEATIQRLESLTPPPVAPVLPMLDFVEMNPRRYRYYCESENE